MFIDVCGISVNGSDFHQNISNYCVFLDTDFESQIVNNVFSNNSGFAVYSGYGDHSYLAGNLMEGNNGGIFGYLSEATLINNTIVNNNYGIGLNNNSSLAIYNSIIGNNIFNNILLSSDDCDPVFYNCNIEGGEAGFDGVGSGAEYNGTLNECIDTDPLFVDTSSGDYRLSENSLCINAGTTVSITVPDIDLAGNPRISGDTIDIGAYEYVVIPHATIQPGHNFTHEESIIVTISFSEIVTGFEISDLMITNGNASGMTENFTGMEYTVVITAIAPGTVIIQLPANSVMYQSGLENVLTSGEYSYLGPLNSLNAGYSVNKYFYPNPAHDKLTVITGSKAKITLYDLAGKPCFIAEDIKDETINITSLLQGMYMIKIETKTGVVIQKFIKE